MTCVCVTVCVCICGYVVCLTLYMGVCVYVCTEVCVYMCVGMCGVYERVGMCRCRHKGAHQCSLTLNNILPTVKQRLSLGFVT